MLKPKAAGAVKTYEVLYVARSSSFVGRDIMMRTYKGRATLKALHRHSATCQGGHR